MPTTLAAFFGVFFAVSMATALVLSLFVTSRLLGRFGVPTVVLVLPVLYLVAFGVLAVAATFATLAAFRFAQIAWRSGGAGSTWEALVNTIPAHRRDRVRAFLIGVPTQVGTIVAGAVALIAQRFDEPRVLYGAGFVGAALAVASISRIRSAYPRALVAALREGRPTIFGTPGPRAAILNVDAVGLAVLRDLLTDHEVTARLLAANALADLDVPEAAEALAKAAQEDDETEVRLAALAVARARGCRTRRGGLGRAAIRPRIIGPPRGSWGAGPGRCRPAESRARRPGGLSPRARRRDCSSNVKRAPRPCSTPSCTRRTRRFERSGIARSPPAAPRKHGTLRWPGSMIPTTECATRPHTRSRPAQAKMRSNRSSPCSRTMTPSYAPPRRRRSERSASLLSRRSSTRFSPRAHEDAALAALERLPLGRECHASAEVRRRVGRARTRRRRATQQTHREQRRLRCTAARLASDARGTQRARRASRGRAAGRTSHQCVRGTGKPRGLRPSSARNSARGHRDSRRSSDRSAAARTLGTARERRIRR